MSIQSEKQVEKFVAKQLAIGIDREQIIAQLCEDYAIDWEEAEAFLLDLEIRQGPKLRSNRSLMVIMGTGAILLGSLFVGVYIIGALVSRNTINMLPVVFAFISGISLFVIALSIYSRHENSIKERYRCPHCSYLVNRLGHENPMVLPRYESCTYHTIRKLLSTRTVRYSFFSMRLGTLTASLKSLKSAGNATRSEEKRSLKRRQNIDLFHHRTPGHIIDDGMSIGHSLETGYRSLICQHTTGQKGSKPYLAKTAFLCRRISV